MRAGGIAGYRKRRRVRTTVPYQAASKYPDLMGRDFTADAPNRKYVGDITYLPLAGGSNLYLATVIDRVRQAPGRLGGARPHAHIPRGRRPTGGRADPREP